MQTYIQCYRALQVMQYIILTINDCLFQTEHVHGPGGLQCYRALQVMQYIILTISDCLFQTEHVHGPGGVRDRAEVLHALCGQAPPDDL